MTVKVEFPKVEKSATRDDESRETHPAYAMIGASRVSGEAVLYGSDFKHQHYIVLRICHSELTRTLSNDWPHGHQDIIEVAMSEAQWAAFVSTLNVGSGVQCTLQHVNRERVPQLPEPTARHHQFKSEAKERMADAIAAMKALRERISNSKLSQKEKDAQLSELDSCYRMLTDGLPWVAQQFGEHMESVTEQARIEIGAYIINTVSRAGLQALLDKSGPPIALPNLDKKP